VGAMPARRFLTAPNRSVTLDQALAARLATKNKSAGGT